MFLQFDIPNKTCPKFTIKDQGQNNFNNKI